MEIVFVQLRHKLFLSKREESPPGHALIAMLYIKQFWI